MARHAPRLRRPLAGLALLLVGCHGAPPATRWDPGAGTPRPARVRLAVQGRAQLRSLSCESRSASDLLAYYGVSVSEAAFLDGLPRSDNPDLGFVGDVDGPGGRLPPEGYGVHAEPIAARLGDLGLPALARRAGDLDWLRDRIAAGRPVIVWATGDLEPRAPVRLRDGRGRAFRAVRGEHTYLAVGYTRGEILLLDAATGEQRACFARRFDSAWATLGRMAVVPERAPLR